MEEIAEISKYPHYRNIIKPAGDQEKDGTVQEVVFKFIAYKNERENYSSSVRDFLDWYAAEHGDDIDLDHEREVFEEATQELDRVVDGIISRESGYITPISLLEGVLVAAGELVEDDDLPFTPNSGWLDDAELYENTTRGTNAKRKLNGRIRRSKELLKGAEVK